MKAYNLSILNIVTLIFMLLMNTLALALPLNNLSTAQVSQLYDNLFVPAGITFSIWGIIYILLIIFVIVQFIQVKNNRVGVTMRVGYLFAISNVANGLWIIAWHNLKIFISLILMITILFSLILIYTNLKIGYKRPSTKLRKFTVFLPFSIYIGWISVATIANIAALLVSLGINMNYALQTLITMIVIAVAGTLASTAIRLKTDYYYAGVIIFSLFGIIIKRLQSPPLNAFVAMTAFITILVIAYNIYLHSTKNRYID